MNWDGPENSNRTQFYSCFIGHSAKDEGFVHRLSADLRGRGVRCWLARQDMRIGDEIRAAVDTAIRVYDKMLLILSKHSIDSEWVKREIDTALEEERRRNQLVLSPIRLDDAVMKTERDWAVLMRQTRHIGDFTCWRDHDSYEKAFEHLLRDLRQTPVKENSEGSPLLPHDEEEILDWDAWITPPPPRRSGSIKVKLVYRGRSKPIPMMDPWAG